MKKIKCTNMLAILFQFNPAHYCLPHPLTEERLETYPRHHVILLSFTLGYIYQK